MERDFMGLNSKDSVVVVKEEAVEGCKESVYTKSSAIHWPLPDGFEGSKNRQSGENQKSIGLNRQGGTHFSMAAYPMQQCAFPLQLHNDTKQAVPIAMSPFFRAQFGGAPIKQHAILPSAGSFLAGTTEPWYSTKASCAPAQLTIFYGGMVNVYDDISAEKAQAIMFLAGNGASVSTPQPRVQAQAPIPRTPAGDAVYVSEPINMQPCSALSSPMSVSSHPVGQSTAVPTNKDEAAKTVGGSVTPISKVDTPRVINSLEQVMQSAVPQARKASLARFLEKRKERVMASAPYSMSKSSSECSANPGASCSANVVSSS
ncbi:protein TIFY 6B-like isoform X1 [Cynara cardunculus var. scolymus]|uniref:Protein TIFY n=1 Tax=Cynara cardunculus var. scolymus TaxID=59895 RepID=A0A124SG63_CYNCS|nr:protein TIFY 6B-like isoform X1 [Cynara cardunculus var. scolymus]XP_024991944.1 protein TIFY 6B-like isoform X1 [Cynara cardunculus var. scolymus]XP_024991945.1 protein TIFY 6B-like isoform X1 [Cynara cardunculus var. scolymus]KVI05428.1 CO/COL/TOC1, conserved site-containing protein [Cynara cardunculus var. scolymus]